MHECSARPKQIAPPHPPALAAYQERAAYLLWKILVKVSICQPTRCSLYNKRRDTCRELSKRVLASFLAIAGRPSTDLDAARLCLHTRRTPPKGFTRLGPQHSKHWSQKRRGSLFRSLKGCYAKSANFRWVIAVQSPLSVVANLLRVATMSRAPFR